MWGNKPPLPCLPRLEKTRQRRIRPFSAPAQKGPELLYKISFGE
ncbi:hypothetical protein HMPREF9535_04924, partial [Escherichia coli MS 78-1]